MPKGHGRPYNADERKSSAKDKARGRTETGFTSSLKTRERAKGTRSEMINAQNTVDALIGNRKVETSESAHAKRDMYRDPHPFAKRPKSY